MRTQPSFMDVAVTLAALPFILFAMLVLSLTAIVVSTLRGICAMLRRER